MQLCEFRRSATQIRNDLILLNEKSAETKPVFQISIVKIAGTFYTSTVAKPYHHGDLHEQLLNAGEAALGEMPVEKVTLREIARRAGVSHAAPKHHFRSLGHLLAEIAARGYRRFIVALKDGADGAANQTPEDRLLGMGRAYVQFAGENAAAYSLMFGQREPVVMTPNLIDASYEAWSEMEIGCGRCHRPGRCIRGCSASVVIRSWTVDAANGAPPAARCDHPQCQGASAPHDCARSQI